MIILNEMPMFTFSETFRNPLYSLFLTMPHLLDKVRNDENIEPEIARMSDKMYSLLRTCTNIDMVRSLVDDKQSFVDFDAIELSKNIMNAAEKVLKHNRFEYSIEVASKDAVIYGSVDLFSRTVFEIIRNSLQYSSDHKKISIKIDVQDNFILTIRDYGLGIIPEYLDRIFEPYFSIDPYGDSTERPGMGLGLANATAIIHSMKGVLSITSNPEQGTTVKIAIPTVTDTDDVWRFPPDFTGSMFSPFYVHLNGFCVIPDYYYSFRNR